MNDICQNNTVQASTSIDFHLFSYCFHTSLNTPRNVSHDHSDAYSLSLSRLFLYQYFVLNVFNQSRCFPFFFLFFFSYTKSFSFALVPQSPSIYQDKQSNFTYSIQNRSLLSSLHSSWNCNYNHQFIKNIALSHQNISFCSLSFDRFSIFASISYLASV